MSHQYNTRNRRKRKQPHPSYYVGYCEDGESVDAIMRKFAALEQIQEIKKQKAKENKDPNNKSKSKSPKKNKNNSKNKEKNEKKSSKAEITDSENDDDDEEEEEEDVDIQVNGNKNNNNNDNDSKEEENGLNDDELAQLFVQTSMFSVNSLKNNNEIMRDKPIVDEEGFVTGYDDRVFNSELILAADYKNVNEDLLDKGQFGDDEYNPALDDDTDGDGGDNSDFFEDVLGGEMPTKNGRIRSKKGGGKGAKRSGKGGKSGRKGGSGSGSGNRAGVRNAPKSKDGLGMEDIDKHYAYTYGRRLAPLVEGDAARRARALRLRTCSALYTLKVPKYPMPRSWGHRVKRFNGHRDLYGRDMIRAKKELIGFDYIEHNDLTKLKTSDLPHQEFQAVLIDIPWDVSESLFNPREGMIKYEQLKDYPIADIVENGMLFVWIPSELLSPVVKMIEKVWGFRYVEHATFAKKGINNHFKVKKGELMNYTKENLLIFRKGTAKKFVDRIELRHQRTSDTHINFIRFHEKFKRFEIKPREFAYRMIETMLPDATQEIRDAVNNKTDLSKVASRLLYLWAPQYEHRGGWTMMVDKKHLEYLQNIEDDPKWQDPYFPFKRFY